MPEEQQCYYCALKVTQEYKIDGSVKRETFPIMLKHIGSNHPDLITAMFIDLSKYVDTQ